MSAIAKPSQALDAVAFPLPEAFPDAAGSAVYESIFDLVGNTPLLRVDNLLAAGAPGRVYVKLDQFNYGGSSKDRIGINIVREAIASGALKPDNRIIDFGAGNTAIGYALAGMASKNPVTLVANPTLSPEKASLLRFLGVDIVPGRPDVPGDHPENWATISQRYEDEDPSNWWARQETTGSNPASHVGSTGPEVWHQTDGRVTHFVAAIATGGTVSGTGSYLKSRKPEVEVIASHFSEALEKSNLLAYARRDPGHEALERNFPFNINLDVIDRVEHRARAEVIDYGWHLARTYGLILGPTSVLSLRIAVDLARAAKPGDIIVSFSADSGRDYLHREYNADWLRAEGFGAIADKYAGVTAP